MSNEDENKKSFAEEIWAIEDVYCGDGIKDFIDFVERKPTLYHVRSAYEQSLGACDNAFHAEFYLMDLL